MVKDLFDFHLNLFVKQVFFVILYVCVRCLPIRQTLLKAIFKLPLTRQNGDPS